MMEFHEEYSYIEQSAILLAVRKNEKSTESGQATSYWKAIFRSHTLHGAGKRKTGSFRIKSVYHRTLQEYRK